MALSIVQVLGGVSASPTQVNITTTSGSLIVVVASDSGSSAAPTISDSAGQTYSQAVAVTPTASRSGAIYYFPNSATLTYVKATSAGNSCALTVYEISGADTSTPLDKTGSHALGFSNYTVSASGQNASANDVVIAAVFHYYGNPSTSDGTYTARTDQSTAGTVGERAFDKIVSATETSSMAITVTGYGDLAAIATFKQASGASPDTISVSDTTTTSENIALSIVNSDLQINVSPSNATYFIQGVKIVG